MSKATLASRYLQISTQLSTSTLITIDVYAGIDVNFDAGVNIVIDASIDIDVYAGINVNFDAGVNIVIDASIDINVDVSINTNISIDVDLYRRQYQCWH